MALRNTCGPFKVKSDTLVIKFLVGNELGTKPTIYFRESWFNYNILN